MDWAVHAVQEPRGAPALVGWALRLYLFNWRPVLALSAAAAAARWLLGLIAAQPLPLTHVRTLLGAASAAAGVIGYVPAPWADLVALAISTWVTATLLNFFGGTADAPRTPAAAMAACARIGLRRTWPLLVTGLIIGLVGLVGLVLLLVPGVYILTRWAVAPVAAVAEGQGAVAALGRSGALTRGHFWHVLGTLVLGALAASVAADIVSTLGAAILTGIGLRGAAGIALWADLVSAAATPWTLAMLATLHDDLRLRAGGAL